MCERFNELSVFAVSDTAKLAIEKRNCGLKASHCDPVLQTADIEWVDQ